MYVFARSTVLQGGNMRDAQLWVANITEKVNQITDLNVSVWRNVFSREVGRLSWVAFVEDLAHLEAADDKLSADEAFVSLSDEGAKHTNGLLDDALGQLIYAEGDPDPSNEYASAVTALIAPGQFARGIELGVEIAQRVSKITGIPTALIKGVTGDYSAIEWLTGYANVTAMEDAANKLNADAGFLTFLDKEVAGVYESGMSVTQQTTYRKVL